MRHNQLTPARAATALAQAARRATAALAIILLTATTAGAQETITGLTYNSTGGYYEISDAQDLVDLANYVNGGNNASGKTFKQTADIDMQGVTFTPIGNIENTYVFYGTYDGDGYFIKNISYSNTGSYALSGMFGQVKGTVRNVNLKDCNFTGKMAGGIAGKTNGSALIQNCTVLGGTITCTGNSAAGHFGGIVGYAYGGTVNGCFTTTTFSGNGTSMGPVVGFTGANVTNSYYVNTPGGNSKGTQVTVYDISLGDGVTMSDNFRTAGRTAANTYHFGRENDAITLTAADRDGYILGYASDDVTITDGAFTMPAADVAVAATFSPDPAQFSQDGDTYTINTAGGWNVFCDCLNDNDTYNRFSGKTVRLGADITVTRMAGSEGHAFTGTFDGGDHTLTVSISSSDSYAAPFREIMGATIRNLKVCGSVSGHKHSAGLVSYARGADSSVENTIENCLVATDVSTIVDTDGDCYLGGIVGHGFNCKLTIRGCAFTGSLTSPHNYTGGLQGWSDGNTLILEDDIFAASSVNAANVGFHPIAIHVNNASTTATVSNVYYTIAPTCTTSTRIAAAGKAVRSVTAGTDVILYSPGPLNITNTYYNVSGIRAYTTGGLYYNHDLYYGSGDRLSILLENTRDDEPLGYRYTYAFSGGTADEYEYSADYGETSYHLTMPDEDVTISVNTAALLSDGQQHEVNYMTADGTTGEASAIALDGTETTLAAGWYFVGKDISYNATVTLGGDVNLILADGCEMKVGEDEDHRVSGIGISGYSYTLDIYAQSLGDDMGALSIYNSGSINHGINVKALTVNGGNITADANGSNVRAINATTSTLTINGGNVTANSANSVAIRSGAKIYINGGTVNATGDAQGISGSSLVEINGGTVNATCTGSGYGIRATGSLAINGGNITASSFYAGNGTITLGWTRPADRITASSISTGGGTVAVKDGQALTDGSGHIYTGTLTAADRAALAAPGSKTLQPALQLADNADNATQIATLNGIETAAILAGRTLYKDGSWNTLCLPFDISTASGTLSGDNVQAMTLNTETSNLTDGTLTLNFTDATGQTIPAGTPFIIKWDNTGVNITNPVFEGVTVSNATNDATVEGVLTFTGTYAPVSIGSEGDNTKLYLGAANKLYYPTKARTIGTHRAYFQLADGITAGKPVSSSDAKQIRAFNLNFFDDEATGILTTNFTNSTNSSNEWYSLDGVKLAAKPTAKGLYIHQGKKVAIK